MCTHQREIRNKYTGKTLYVKCGHCPACLQEKASYRVSRIKAQDSFEHDTLLVGLTYRRNDCPFVFRDDAFRFSRGEIKQLPVYRNRSYRKVRQTAAYDIGYKRSDDLVELCRVDFINSCDFHGNKDLAHLHDRIGVCYYPDVQRFLARLRLNLKRNFDFNEEFKTFCCSEYGTKSLRPHFHLLFWIPKGSEETFRSAITASWPFSDIQNFPRAIEKAFRASSYVASYVNCGSEFPQFLKSYFRPHHSYSKDFGANNSIFQLPSVLEKFQRGHLTFFVKEDKQGIPTITERLLPKYIIHRFFPKFKGYARIDVSSLCSVMQRIRGLLFSEERGFLGNEFYEKPMISDGDFINRMSFPVYFSNEDFHKISVRLNNAYQRFCENLPTGVFYTFEDYCQLHTKVWSLYMSDVLRLHLENSDVPLNEKYDNLEELRCKHDYLGKPYPVGFTREMFKVTDPNEFRSVKSHTERFESSFYEHLKHRNVSNVVMSSINEEF